MCSQPNPELTLLWHKSQEHLGDSSSTGKAQKRMPMATRVEDVQSLPEACQSPEEEETDTEDHPSQSLFRCLCPVLLLPLLPSGLSCFSPSLFNPMDCSPPGSSVHGILQARILEWVAISFSRRSSGPRDQTCFSFFFYFCHIVEE